MQNAILPGKEYDSCRSKIGFIPVQNAFYFGSECTFVCIFAKYSSVIGLFAPLCRKKVSVRTAIQRKKDWNMKKKWYGQFYLLPLIFRNQLFQCVFWKMGSGISRMILNNCHQN